MKTSLKPGGSCPRCGRKRGRIDRATQFSLIDKSSRRYRCSKCHAVLFWAQVSQAEAEQLTADGQTVKKVGSKWRQWVWRGKVITTPPKSWL